MRLGPALVTCVVMCASLNCSASEALDNSEKENEFYSFCEYGAEDYEDLKAELTERFPVGSDAEPLIQTIQRSPGHENWWNKKVTGDLKYSTDANRFGYGYSFRCAIEDGNINHWHVLFITDMAEESKIAGFQFSIFFEDENFSARGIPFHFENFGKGPDRENALWSIAGKRTPRNKVREIMLNAGAVDVKKGPKSGKNVDRYKYHLDNESLSVRLGGFYPIIVSFVFSEDGNLRSIQSNY